MLSPETKAQLELQRETYDRLAVTTENIVVAQLARHLAVDILMILEGRARLEDLLDSLEEGTRKLQAVISEIEESSKHEKLTQSNALWLVDIVNEGYREASLTTQEFLEKGESVPDRSKIVAAMMKRLTNPQINFMRRLRKPTLYIVPDTTPDRLIAGLNKKVFKTMNAKDDLYNPNGTPQQDAWNDSNHYKNALAKTTEMIGVAPNQENITGFHFVIAEGDTSEEGAEPGDVDFAWNKAQEMTNDDRIAAFEAGTANTGVSSMNSMGAIIAMAHSLRNKKPLNAKTYLLLPGEPKCEHVKDGYVACCRWDPDLMQVVPSVDGQGNPADDARVCAAVMGKIN